MENIIYPLVSVIVVSLISLIGVLTLSFKAEKLKRFLFLLVSLSVGALLGDVFLHLIPEISEEGFQQYPIFILVGILLFFVLEKFLRWRHCHDNDCKEHNVAPIASINLIGDLAHNIIDGMIIGASYLAGIGVGITTTIAILLHEIPQEIGDFGVLLHGGLTTKKALFYNFLSACGAILGTILSLSLGGKIVGYTQILLPITAGGFLYIAGSDLIPELHKENNAKNSFWQLAFITLGIALMYWLTFLE